MDGYEQRRLAAFDTSDALSDDEDLIPVDRMGHVPVETSEGNRAMSPRGRGGDGFMASRAPVSSMSVQTSKQTHRRRSGARVPAGLIHSIAQNDLYQEEPEDIPDGVM